MVDGEGVDGSVWGGTVVVGIFCGILGTTVGVGVVTGTGAGVEDVGAKTFVSNCPMTFPGGDVFIVTSTAFVVVFIANPIAKVVLDFHTRAVKCPVASEKPGFVKS